MHIGELQTSQPRLIEQALKIYEEAFPAQEREPAENLIQAIGRREQHIPESLDTIHFHVAVEGEDVLAIAIFSYCQAACMGFIPYLAVHPRRRNAGVGSILYQHLVAVLAADGNRLNTRALGVAFEVERPELAPDPVERERRRRRIGFYQRNGAVIVPHLYLVAPPVGAGLPEMAYEIMLHPMAGCRLPLGRAGIEAVVQTVLGHGYRLPADNLFYRRAIASIDLP